jgi:DNA-binding CsgD family transcriptional regulator
MLDNKQNPRGFETPNDYASMHGDRFCGAVPDGSTTYPDHCLHGVATGDQACCWCGDVFVGDNADAVDHVHGSNFHPLTPRELDVAKLLAEGLSNKLIGDRLDISGHTTKYHVLNISKKLGKTTRAGMAAEIVRRGIVL